MLRWPTPLLALALVIAPPAVAQGSPEKVAALELFTSQGCSSCPPADRVFQALADDPDLPDTVVPLAFHVPYWNHLGWPDPFSRDLYQRRQRGYAAAFRDPRVYTPQLVVNGRAHRVGPHDRSTLDRVLAAGAREPPGSLTLAARRRLDEVRIEGKAQLTRDVGPRQLVLWAVLYHHAGPTPVGAGENRGRKLSNPWAVRDMRVVAAATATPGGRLEGAGTFSIPADVGRDHLGVALLLQDRKNREILHARRLDLPARGS